MNKRGDTLPLETTIFIVLNLAFFVVMLIFIWSTSGGKIVYEQAYAKEIALMIDTAKPEMNIFIDMSILNEKFKTGDLKEVIKIDTLKKEVILSLSSGRGYSYRYYSGNDISMEIKGDILELNIKEKK
jgi:hypothetical protein